MLLQDVIPHIPTHFLESEMTISSLVQLACTHKIEIPIKDKSIDLLVALLDMGPEAEAEVIRQALACRVQQPDTLPSSVVFGFSGNPPTESHFLFIQHLLDTEPAYARVYTILNATSPLKSNPNDYTYIPTEGRIEMKRAGLEATGLHNNPRCIDETIETDRAAPSRMVATLSAMILRAERDNAPEAYTLALGMDALPTFKRWYKCEAILGLCDIKFFPREDESLAPDEMQSALAELHALYPHAKLSIESALTIPGGSATAARAHYQAGLEGPPPGILPEVDSIMREHGFCGATPKTPKK